MTDLSAAPKAECRCSWRSSSTPCREHGHHRATRTSPWLCFVHEHSTTTIEDQPAPVPGVGTPVWDLVINDMKTRDVIGRERYGTPLQVENGRDHLVDAYQEALDLVVYVRAEIERRRSVRIAALTEFRTGVYALISGFVADNRPGDWMKFEDDINKLFDSLATA